MIVQWCNLCFIVFLHLWITITKCSRYKPDLVKALFEDSFLVACFFAIFCFNFNRKQLLDVIELLENVFSKTDMIAIQKCEFYCKIIFIIIFTLFNAVACLYVTEVFLPLSAKELEIRRIVYNTNNPERRLPYHFVVPFIDEADLWIHWPLFVYGIYMIVLNICLLSLSTTFIPITLLHLQAQYKMLAKHIAKIGEKHMDSMGKEIFYTNIVSSAFHSVSTKDKNGKAFDAATLRRRKEIYELNYIKQIVQYHQNLIIFQEKVSDHGVRS